MRNADVVAVFEEIADLMDIKGENRFRVRAYRNAALTLGALGNPVAELVRQGADLDALPGIGPDLAGKITEIVHTGTCALLERLRKELPVTLRQLLQLPGVGPKRVALLYKHLGVKNIDDLHRAAQDGRVRDVPGFGADTERRILQSAAAHLKRNPRFRRTDAQPLAEELLAFLRHLPGVHHGLAAGSLRRGRDTVGNLDLLVAADPDNDVSTRFAAHPWVRRILELGGTRARVLLDRELQVDLRVVRPDSFGAAAVYFTGSKSHNIALRRLAQASGLKINEYGVFRDGTRIAGDTEESVYRALGLVPVEPELREDRGELLAARQSDLPQLVQLEDLRGDLHAHTLESDGHDTLEAMVDAARRRGLQYLAITEHSRHLAVARGLDPLRLSKQIDRIDRLNEGLQDFVVLKGIEVDILEDGSLDLPDSILSKLDLVVAAIHHRFDLPRARQTERILRAMDSRHFSVLAHPTGRLIDQRPASDIDLLRILRKARQRGCFVELNCQPSRLDLDDRACQMARSEGVLVSIASDAHSGPDLDHLRLGITQARRGWLQAGDVLNTRPLPELRLLLRSTTA